MTIIIVIIPLLIVKGCSTVINDIVPAKSDKLEQEPEQAKTGEVIIGVYIKAQDETKEMPLEEYIKVLLPLKCLLILKLRH